MDQYGHLRPGTYDILSPRYDQLDPEELLNGLHTPISKNIHSESDEGRQSLNKELPLSNGTWHKYY